MAIDVTPAFTSAWARAATSATSSGCRTVPSARIRSATSRRRLRGTSGSGFAMSRSYSSNFRSRPISRVSAKPAVVMSPVTAPLRSISALVKSVVAWTVREKAVESARARGHRARRIVVGGEDLAAVAPAGVVVVDDQVGEGPADVDAERVLGHGA